MTDLHDLPEELVELFGSTATDAEVPTLPLHDVLDRGAALQRVRRRRAAIWTAAAAAVAVVAVSVPLAVTAQHSHGERMSTPSHQTSTPTGPAAGETTGPTASPAAVAVIRNGDLTVGFDGAVLARNVQSVVQAGATILASHGGTSDGSPLTVSEVSSNGLSSPIAALGDAHGDGLGGPVLSPDGSIAVGASQDAGGATLTEWSMTASKVVGTVKVPQGSSQTLHLDGVDDQGRAYLTTYAPRSGSTWQPGIGLRPMTGAAAALWAAGFHAVGPNGPVDSPGCTDQPLAVSPDGSEVLCDAVNPSGWSAAFAIVPAAGGSAVAVGIPAGADAAVIGFDTNTSVLLTETTAGQRWLVRCVVADGACSQVTVVPAGTTFPRVLMGGAGPSTKPPSTPGSVSLDPKEPFVRGTTLYADGQTFEVGKHINLVDAGPTVLVGHWGTPITWRTLRDGHLVPLPYGEGTVPVLNPSGTQVGVRTNPTSQTSRITIYSARSDAEIAHVDLDLPATCCDGGSVQQLSIDSAGTVHWVEDRGRSAPQMEWRPGSAPRQVGAGNP